MPNDHFRYALELIRNDGASAGQFPVEIDWEPIRQWARFDALRRDEPQENSQQECPALPYWDEALGKPYVSGFELTENADEIVPTHYLGSPARSLANQLVDEGKLEIDTYGFRVLAYPVNDRKPATFSMTVETVNSDPVVTEGDLAELLPRARQCGDLTENDLPAFVPQRVLDECRQLTSAANGQETGGILIGGLGRDAATGAVFLETTAQISAQHTVAAETSLAFTPETWTQVQGAIDLRQRNEIMLGWWHSHPIKAWCAKCPPEKRKKCPLLVDYFSAQDRLLHRTVFPAAYSIALVVNELAEDKQTISMFGWRKGLVVQRGFQVLDCPRATEPDRDSNNTQEEV